MNKKSKNKGISRIDSGSTHGWFVRGYRNAKVYSKLFSDKKCGGKQKAYNMAVSYRDDLIGEITQIPKKARGRRIVTSDRRNKTGVIGVCRTVKKSPNGNSCDCYSVSWRPEPGIQRCTSFSIKKYGEKKAFQLAVAHRKKMERQIYGTKVSREPIPA